MYMYMYYKGETIMFVVVCIRLSLFFYFHRSRNIWASNESKIDWSGWNDCSCQNA